MTISNYARWMQSIPESKPLNQITIPGTHDTCTSKIHLDFVRTQDKTVAEQLSNGIRFLDARCRHIEDVFAMHHGSYYLELMFGDVLNDVRSFLSSNPTECVIVSVKEEYNAANNKLTFAQVFEQRYYTPYSTSWFAENRVPQMHEVRGKMVLLRRSSISHGINATGWKDNATFDLNNGVPIHIQDQYDVTTVFGISGKWDHVQTALDKAKADSSGTLYVNFTSGASSGAYPNAIAYGSSVNHGILRRLSDYLDKKENKSGHFGILPMDFVDHNDWEVVKKLAATNF